MNSRSEDGEVRAVVEPMLRSDLTFTEPFEAKFSSVEGAAQFIAVQRPGMQEVSFVRPDGTTVLHIKGEIGL